MSAFASHRIVGGSSRGSGKARVDVVHVDRDAGEPVEELCPCGGARVVGQPHAPIWRSRGGRDALVDCDGREWHRAPAGWALGARS